jgi:hypothetical protein
MTQDEIDRLPRIPGTPYPDLRVKDPPPPRDGPTPLTVRRPGESPTHVHLPDDQVAQPRPAVRGFTRPGK